jgi:DNA-binding transcriptional regulator YiaG
MTPDQIRAIRQQHNLTAAELADVLGVSRKTIHNWEQELAVPTGPALLLLAALRDGTVDSGGVRWSWASVEQQAG